MNSSVIGVYCMKHFIKVLKRGDSHGFHKNKQDMEKNRVWA